MMLQNSRQKIKHLSVYVALAALIIGGTVDATYAQVPPAPSVVGDNAEAAPPSFGSFESLLNSLPAPKVEEKGKGQQAAVPEMNQMAMPGMALPQQGGMNQPPPIPGMSEDEVGGLSREEQLRARAEKEKRQFYEEAYGLALDSMFPLKPEEIRRFMEIYDENRQSIDTLMYNRPTPEVGVKTLSLDPGQIPDSIDAAMGHVTTVSVVDVTGAPWPVLDMTWAGEFDIIKPDPGGNIFRITPTTHFAKGNLSMRLIGLKTPIVISLNTRRDKVYYRLDLRIPEYGPEAEAPLINSSLSITAGSANMASVLDGMPPQAAEALVVSGTDARTRAYKLNGLTYVRTPLTLLSPGWSSSVRSGDGMNVYEINDAPVLLLSDGGQMVRVSLTEDDSE